MSSNAIQADLLRHFPQLVRELGGSPEALLKRIGVGAPDCYAAPPHLDYRHTAEAVQLAASALQRPDFGMLLASRQGSGEVFGVVGALMRNTKTFGDAIRYASAVSHEHCLASHIRTVHRNESRHYFVGHDIVFDHGCHQTQAMEHILLLTHLNASAITGGVARAREVHFRHQPVSSLSTYRQYFGCDVRFDEAVSGVMFAEQDMLAPIISPDHEALPRALASVESQAAASPMHVLVRAQLLKTIGRECCTNGAIASALGLHPKTLLRRLREEATSFHQIREEVRHDMALYYLESTELEISQIALKLGYAEHSVFSRSCLRWFGLSPSQVRARKAPRPSDYEYMTLS